MAIFQALDETMLGVDVMLAHKEVVCMHCLPADPAL